MISDALKDEKAPSFFLIRLYIFKICFSLGKVHLLILHHFLSGRYEEKLAPPKNSVRAVFASILCLPWFSLSLFLHFHLYSPFFLIFMTRSTQRFVCVCVYGWYRFLSDSPRHSTLFFPLLCVCVCLWCGAKRLVGKYGAEITGNAELKYGERSSHAKCIKYLTITLGQTGTHVLVFVKSKHIFSATAHLLIFWSFSFPI